MAKIVIHKRCGIRGRAYSFKELKRAADELGVTLLPSKPWFFVEVIFEGDDQFLLAERKRITDRLLLINRHIIYKFFHDSNDGFIK